MRERETNARADGKQMGARRWAIAAKFRDPSDYDIPELPDWVEGCDREGRLCLCAGHAREPFIAAGNPVPVRR